MDSFSLWGMKKDVWNSLYKKFASEEEEERRRTAHPAQKCTLNATTEEYKVRSVYSSIVTRLLEKPDRPLRDKRNEAMHFTYI